MKTLIKIEEAGLFVLGIYLFSILNYAWWLFPALIFVPDLSMIGYAFGNKIGAGVYNAFHHRALAVVIYLAGIYTANEVVQLTGVMLFSHSSMDRMFGYGLKLEQGFKFTHLGEIGKNA
jgi:hypothetical protein